MKHNKKYTWKPDLPDHRDFSFKSLKLQSLAAEKLPSSVDLRNHCSPVEDQGQLGSCTGNSLVALLELNQKILTNNVVDLSRLFIYYNERVIENTVKQDSGAMLRDGIKTLASYGVCEESLWPYKISKFTNKPNTKCYKSAVKYKISSYYRLSTINDMKTALANNHAFVFGFSVYDSFESEEVAKTGIVNLPTSSEKQLGGHAVCCVGYDDSTSRFLIKNSWGINWGMSGYFTMPYAYLENRDLSDDFWTIVK